MDWVVDIRSTALIAGTSISRRPLDVSTVPSVTFRSARAMGCSAERGPIDEIAIIQTMDITIRVLTTLPPRCSPRRCAREHCICLAKRDSVPDRCIWTRNPYRLVVSIDFGLVGRITIFRLPGIWRENGP